METSAEKASITIEAEAVTVARWVAGSRSKGKPLRIPSKHCRDRSPQIEARVQAGLLMKDGFVFESEDGTMPGGDGKAVLYVIIRTERIDEAIEYVTGSELPPRLSMQRLSDGRVRVIDVQEQEITLQPGCELCSVTTMSSDLVALVLLLSHHGIAEVSHDACTGTNGETVVDAKNIYRIATLLQSETTEFLVSQGIQPPGVLTSQHVSRAVLL